MSESAMRVSISSTPTLIITETAARKTRRDSAEVEELILGLYD